MKTPLWAIGLVLSASVINGIAGVFLKLGTERSRLSWSGPRLDARLLLGVFFYGLASVLYVVSLRGGELSILYPLISLTYLWIFCLSHFVLGERLTVSKIVGGLLLVLGVSLVGLGA